MTYTSTCNCVLSCTMLEHKKKFIWLGFITTNFNVSAPHTTCVHTTCIHDTCTCTCIGIC